MNPSEVATEMVRAAFSHRGIMAAGRMAEYPLLLKKTDRTLDSLFRSVAVLPHLQGEVTVEAGANGVRPADSVIKAISGMVAVYIIKSAEFLTEALKKHKGNMEDALNSMEHLKLRSRCLKAREMLPSLLKADEQWGILVRRHRQMLGEVRRTLSAVPQ